MSCAKNSSCVHFGSAPLKVLFRIYRCLDRNQDKTQVQKNCYSEKEIEKFQPHSGGMVLMTSESLSCASFSMYSAVFVNGYSRSNKLSMDEYQGEGSISKPMEEVYLFTPIEVPPLADVSVVSVAMGTSHTAVITGQSLCPIYPTDQPK
jgi:hypothetical protein